MAQLRLIDSHIHLDMEEFQPDRETVIQRAREKGVAQLLQVAMGPFPERVHRSVRLAESDPQIFLLMGIHPHDAKEPNQEFFASLPTFLKNPKVKGIGEIGLDFHYNHSLKEDQESCFEKLLQVALDHQKPVSIHSREAFSETFSWVKQKEIFSKVGGVVHCFSGNKKEAFSYLDLGAWIGVGGISTFPKAQELQEVIQAIPLEKIILETDAPFLAPHPHRGKRNEPLFLVEIARRVAELKKTTLEEVANITSQNTSLLFHLE